MKHFLRLMGRLCPISNPYKTKLTAMVAVTTLFMCLIAAFKAPAQTGAAATMDEIKPLQIGDTIPEELWHLPLQVVNHPEGKETITLNNYRGKLIILDFWGTFCSACISAMPNIRDVQEQFVDDMVIIPISWSTPEDTRKSLTSHHTLKPMELFSVVEEKRLINTFPHRVVPFYVWINANGEIVATTATNDVNDVNVAKVLVGQPPNYALMTGIDYQQPLFFLTEVLPHDITLQQYAVFIRGGIPSLGSLSTLRYTDDGKVNGMAILNRNLQVMYTNIAERMKGRHPGKRLVLLDPMDDNIPYTLDFILPINQADSLYAYMLDYLNRHSGYIGHWVERYQTCLILIESSTAGTYASKGGDESRQVTPEGIELKNTPIDHFIARLNRNDISDDLLVLNETGHDGSVDITLREPFDDLKAIRHQLSSYGLDLVEANRLVEIFEVRRTNPIN